MCCTRLYYSHTAERERIGRKIPQWHSLYNCTVHTGIEPGSMISYSFYYAKKTTNRVVAWCAVNYIQYILLFYIICTAQAVNLAASFYMIAYAIRHQLVILYSTTGTGIEMCCTRLYYSHTAEGKNWNKNTEVALSVQLYSTFGNRTREYDILLLFIMQKRPLTGWLHGAR